MPTLAVDDIIDSRPLGSLQKRVIALCFVLASIDGFDLASMGYVAPLVADIFALGPASVGTLLAAALVGLMFGALVGSPLADRHGRKPVIIAAVGIMGVFSLLTAFADSAAEPYAFRFLTGLGLGALMPAINILTAECVPNRLRALLMTVMFAGFPFGMVVGGAVSSQIVGNYGWPPVFVLGGVVPLAIIPVLFLWLPESPRFLAATGKNAAALGRVMQDLSSGEFPATETEWRGNQQEAVRANLGDLFTARLAIATPLLWLAFFGNLLSNFGLLGWLPSLLNAMGAPLERAILITLVYSTGGVLGGIFIAMLIDRLGARRVLPIALGIAFAFVALIGVVATSLPVLLVALFVAGAASIGSQFGLNAFASGMYDVTARTTGLGWALAAGRVGGIVGPIMVGITVSAGISMPWLFLLGALPMLAATLSIFLVTRLISDSAVGEAT